MMTELDKIVQELCEEKNRARELDNENNILRGEIRNLEKENKELKKEIARLNNQIAMANSILYMK